MFFKPNMIVVLTHGRLAGKKAVVVKELPDNYLLVAGINRTPQKSEEFAPKWLKRKNEKFLTFLKKININHVLATRYKAEVKLNPENLIKASVDITSKAAANDEINKAMREAYDEQKCKWLFTQLKF